MTKPLNSLFGLFGSKFRQRKNILPILARYKRTMYVEPFGGAGGLLFGKEPERVEVYNDINKCFVNLFHVVKDNDNVKELQYLLEISPMSRELWSECYQLISEYYMGGVKSKDQFGLKDYSDEVVLAYAVFYLQNFSFSGKFMSSFAGIEKGRNAGNKCSLYRTKRERLMDYHDRMKTVCIENLDAIDCIRRYDDENTLFYIDPPYACNTKDAYKTGEFHEQALVELLKTIKGNFVLSCYDTDCYKSLEAICDKYEFDAYKSADKQGKRRSRACEVVYASKVDYYTNVFLG